MIPISFSFYETSRSLLSGHTHSAPNRAQSEGPARDHHYERSRRLAPGCSGYGCRQRARHGRGLSMTISGLSAMLLALPPQAAAGPIPPAAPPTSERMLNTGFSVPLLG